MKISKVETWSVDLVDQPGGLAQVLEMLSVAGANLQCVIGRRKPEMPGSGVVYVTPIKGKKVIAAAKAMGMTPSGIATVRVEGADKRGTGAALTEAISNSGLNLRGLTSVVAGKKFVCYIGLDRQQDVERCIKAIKRVKNR